MNVLNNLLKFIWLEFFNQKNVIGKLQEIKNKFTSIVTTVVMFLEQNVPNDKLNPTRLLVELAQNIVLGNISVFCQL